MAISNCEILLTEQPLVAPAPEWSGEAGAVVEFWGVVRAHEGERAIVGLQYETHAAMARHQLGVVAARAVAEFTLTRLILQHRIGIVRVAEPSLFLRACSGHRQAAFAASTWIVEELKRVVPIWKQPVFEEAVATQS